MFYSGSQISISTAPAPRHVLHSYNQPLIGFPASPSPSLVEISCIISPHFSLSRCLALGFNPQRRAFLKTVSYKQVAVSPSYQSRLLDTEKTSDRLVNPPGPLQHLDNLNPDQLGDTGRKLDRLDQTSIQRQLLIDNHVWIAIYPPARTGASRLDHRECCGQ